MNAPLNLVLKFLSERDFSTLDVILIFIAANVSAAVANYESSTLSGALAAALIVLVGRIATDWAYKKWGAA
jgi:hypothetical protein